MTRTIRLAARQALLEQRSFWRSAEYALFTFAFPLMILLLIAPTIYVSLRAAWRGEAPPHNPRYYDVPLEARVRYGSYYLLLLGFLCVMTYRTHLQVEALRGL